MTRRARAALAAAALLTVSTGCASAVKHPAIAVGVVAGTLGFGTCKLESADTTACLGVAGGAGALLGLVTAAALWLIGDEPADLDEEQVQPIPDDDRPIQPPRPAEPVAPTALPPDPAPPASTPIEPPPTAPTSTGSPSPTPPPPS